ncbi:MAG: threo-3-hydroxy-L-aspartate ammonia-lyase [Spirulinaceae cyanobacterium]
MTLTKETSSLTPNHQSNLAVAYKDIATAAKNGCGIVHRTPVVTSTTVNKKTDSEVFFKCENFQRAGSFKFRGAYNALFSLSASQKQRGVITYSSGNHAQAIALAGKLLDIPRTIIMPDNAPDVKIAATRDYGAEVILYDPATTDREKLTQEISTEQGLKVIPPYNYAPTVAGQGTAAKELIEEIGEIDLLLVPCGGGGLLSGCAIAAKTLSPQCRIIGVEPKQADDATRSFHTGVLHKVNNPDTIADGARTPCLGEINFPLVLHYVDDMVTVSEEAIISTMFFLWERLKIVVEPTGCLAAAALLQGVVTYPKAKIGVIISGGNVSLSSMREWGNKS